MVKCKGLLKLRQISTRGHQQAIDVEERIAGPRFGGIHPLQHHCLADQLGDAGCRRATPKKQEALLGEVLP